MNRLGLPPSLRRLARSSSAQTFVVFPALVLAAEALRRGAFPRLDGRFLPLLAGGYLQYRLCGDYRGRRGGGGPGFDRPPERLVTTGPYALTRNPMYLGHLLFTAGLALCLHSPLAWCLLLERWARFSRRVSRDEARLERLFGARYRAYRAAVPRWIPAVSGGAPSQPGASSRYTTES
ncbi:MAG TPA: isoprenylcysteine carboxylmethyltransferase family protein [Candidatus Acidoferrales bacterium]|nr:isoprenylcysteine carboxylmethyltransferase family protein [Candidatus Acidoferrales bacterium]